MERFIRNDSIYYVAGIGKMTYDEFLEARDIVLSAYPSAICKYDEDYESFHIYQIDNPSCVFWLGSSKINEPDAWMSAAETVKFEFLKSLEL